MKNVCQINSSSREWRTCVFHEGIWTQVLLVFIAAVTKGHFSLLLWREKGEIYRAGESTFRWQFAEVRPEIQQTSHDFKYIWTRPGGRPSNIVWWPRVHEQHKGFIHRLELFNEPRVHVDIISFASVSIVYNEGKLSSPKWQQQWMKLNKINQANYNRWSNTNTCSFS